MNDVGRAFLVNANGHDGPIRPVRFARSFNRIRTDRGYHPKEEQQTKSHLVIPCHSCLIQTIRARFRPEAQDTGTVNGGKNANKRHGHGVACLEVTSLLGPSECSAAARYSKSSLSPFRAVNPVRFLLSFLPPGGSGGGVASA